MRQAEIDKAWAICRGQRSTLDVREILTKVGGASQKIELASRIVAVVGCNGAGKTSWLEQIYSHYQGNLPKIRKALEVLKVSGIRYGTAFVLPEYEAQIEHQSTPPTQYINIASEVNHVVSYARKLDNLEELLPQVGAKVATQKEIGIVQHVLQKNYTRIETYELEHPDNPDHTFPHFVVEQGNAKYDGFSMGFGELCSFYIIWLCSRAHKGSILLLDEPDSHLSPRARKALLDFLALVAAERYLHILFSSHAAETVAHLNPNEVLYFSEAGQPLISQALQKHIALRNLGLKGKPKLLLITEDVDAHEFLLQIWMKWGNDFRSIVEIRIMQGGAVELARIQRLFPQDSDICTLQVILDGDKRNEFPGQNLMFLPGTEDPVVASRRYAILNPERFSEYLGIDIETLMRAIVETQHVDHHDFCSTLSDRLDAQGIDTKRVRVALFKTWLSDPENAKESKALADEITSKARLLA
jgi:predicted ATPase